MTFQMVVKGAASPFFFIKQNNAPVKTLFDCMLRKELVTNDKSVYVLCILQTETACLSHCPLDPENI